MGNSSEFRKAVKLVIDTVSFDTDSTVQVFEATIRYVACVMSQVQSLPFPGMVGKYASENQSSCS